MARNVIGRFAGYVGLLILLLSTHTIGCRGTEANIPNRSVALAKGDFIMADLTRQELTQRAASLGNPILTTLEKPETVVERMPTGYFLDGGIYRVSTRPPDRPRTYVLGVWGKNEIIVLNNEPDAFFKLAANAGLKLTAGGDYVDYVKAFLDSTRDYTGGIQVLNKIDESWWLPKPTPEEARRREEVTAKYTHLVEAPKSSQESNSSVIVYCIRDRNLLRMKAKVENDGKIRISEDLLEAKMPTVMLR